jgi:hypothetical protein
MQRAVAQLPSLGRQEKCIAWGTKEFYIEDPDGYIVSFGGTE